MSFSGPRPSKRARGVAASRWRLLPLQYGDASWQFAVEEAVLETVGAGLAPPTVRLYSLQRPAVCLGASQLSAEADGHACEQARVQVVRRQSGGTAVYLNAEQLGYSITLPNGHRLAPLDVIETYRRCMRPVALALRRLGLPVRSASAAIARASDRLLIPAADRACLSRVAPCELLLHGRKVVAHAQVRRRAVLVHGLVLVRHEPRALPGLLAFAHEEERIVLSSLLAARVGQLATESNDLQLVQVVAALEYAMVTLFGGPPDQCELLTGERDRALMLQHEKYASDEWTYRR